MIICVADSGATKTEWRLLMDSQLIASEFTTGFNPNAMGKDVLEGIVQVLCEKETAWSQADEIYFYGSGLRFEEDQKRVGGSLQVLAPNADVTVLDDLTGAVRSTLRHEGIVAILGTGSNACFHQNFELKQTLGGHGYLLGDEGSGMDLGKYLLKSLLQDELPAIVRERVESGEKKDVLELRKSIYSHKHPNQKLASLAKYLPDMMDLTEIQSLVNRRFLAFLETTICRIEGNENLPVDFVGGISHYFEIPLKKACDQKGLRFGRIIRNPIEQLVEFHLSFSKN